MYTFLYRGRQASYNKGYLQILQSLYMTGYSGFFSCDLSYIKKENILDVFKGVCRQFVGKIFLLQC